MITIHRRDGSVLFHSATATTTAQAVTELVAEARRNLSDAELRSANLSGADLRSADLSGSNLSGADLRSADLSGSNLSGADLSGADLRSADLRSADLSGSNLRSADLSSADLRSADLRYANLSGADLRSADLSDAELRSANLSGAVGISGFFQLGPIDNWWLSIMLGPDGWIFRAGCRRFPEAQAREWWRPENLPAWTKGSAPEHGARMLAGADALIALARAHGWPEKLEEENPE